MKKEVKLTNATYLLHMCSYPFTGTYRLQESVSRCLSLCQPRNILIWKSLMGKRAALFCFLKRESPKLEKLRHQWIVQSSLKKWAQQLKKKKFNTVSTINWICINLTKHVLNETNTYLVLIRFFDFHAKIDTLWFY